MLKYFMALISSNKISVIAIAVTIFLSLVNIIVAKYDENRSITKEMPSETLPNDIENKIDLTFNFKHAKNILARNVKNKDLTINNFKWLDLKGSGKIDSVYINYSIKGVVTNYHDIYYFENNGENRIYHEGNIPGFSGLSLGVYNEITYILIYTIQGTGAFLSGNVYKLNMLNKLENIGPIKSENPNYPLKANKVTSVNKSIVISSNGNNLLLEIKNNKVFLKKYISKEKYMDFGENKHILEVMNCENQEIKFDNVIIPDNYLTINSAEIVKKIKVGDDILIKNNKVIFRIAINDNFEFPSDLETVVRAKEKGLGSIYIDCSTPNVINLEIE